MIFAGGALVLFREVGRAISGGVGVGGGPSDFGRR